MRPMKSRMNTGRSPSKWNHVFDEKDGQRNENTGDIPDAQCASGHARMGDESSCPMPGFAGDG